MIELATGEIIAPLLALAEPVTQKVGLAPAAGTTPVTGAVQVKLVLTPFARLATEAGAGPLKAPMVAVPRRVSAEGVTLEIVLPVLLVTSILNVAVSPGKIQGEGLATISTLSGLTRSVLETAGLDVALLVLLRTLAVKNTVPELVDAVAQV